MISRAEYHTRAVLCYEDARRMKRGKPPLHRPGRNGMPAWVSYRVARSIASYWAQRAKAVASEEAARE